MQNKAYLTYEDWHTKANWKWYWYRLMTRKQTLQTVSNKCKSNLIDYQIIPFTYDQTDDQPAH